MSPFRNKTALLAGLFMAASAGSFMAACNRSSSEPAAQSAGSPQPTAQPSAQMTASALPTTLPGANPGQKASTDVIVACYSPKNNALMRPVSVNDNKEERASATIVCRQTHFPRYVDNNKPNKLGAPVCLESTVNVAFFCPPSTCFMKAPEKDKDGISYTFSCTTRAPEIICPK